MAYTIAKALKKVMGVETLVMAQTKQYLSQYFEVGEELPALEEAFCDWPEAPFEGFEGGVDELLADVTLRTGKLLNLWPRGYKVNIP